MMSASCIESNSQDTGCSSSPDQASANSGQGQSGLPELTRPSPLEEGAPSPAEEGASSNIDVSATSNGSISYAKAAKSKWIRLNVGGKHFVTTFSTLSKYPKSFLYRLCQEDPDIDSDKVCAAIGLTDTFLTL